MKIVVKYIIPLIRKLRLSITYIKDSKIENNKLKQIPQKVFGFLKYQFN